MYENNINRLFDRVIAEKGLPSDAALSRLLEVTPSVICRMRSHKILPGASIILALVERGDIPLADVRAAIPRKGDVRE